MLKHIAIIPDGNRRWAKENGVSLAQVYLDGSRKMLNLSKRLLLNYPGLNDISLFFVSFENLQSRKESDLNPLFEAGLSFLDDFHEFASDEKIKSNALLINLLDKLSKGSSLK